MCLCSRSRLYTPSSNLALAGRTSELKSAAQAKRMTRRFRHNFGMPTALKAYFDQIVRVGRTIPFNPEADAPYVGPIPSKPVIVTTSKGAVGYEPGGPYASTNFLEPHIAGLLAIFGLTHTGFVKVDMKCSRTAAWTPQSRGQSWSNHAFWTTWLQAGDIVCSIAR